MAFHFRDLEEQATTLSSETGAAIANLRRSVWADGRIDRVEADTLFLANDQLRGSDREWEVFFTEALVEYMVDAGDCPGRIDETRARWLKARIVCDGRIAERDELEVLLRALERADMAPEWLRALALDEIEQAVLTGTGATRRDGAIGAGSINADEVKALRRVLFAQGGPGICRNGIERLFRIKGAALDGDNAPEWERLFVEAAAAYLLGFGGIYNLSSDRSAELEEFLSHTGARIGRFLARSMREAVDESGIFQLLDADEALDPMEKALLACLATMH